MTAGVDVVLGATEKFAQVGEHVAIGVETKNAAAGAKPVSLRRRCRYGSDAVGRILSSQ
jgi:hypothetical protein